MNRTSSLRQLPSALRPRRPHEHRLCPHHAPRRIIVAISGASGAVYGVRLLQVLRDTPGIESHLVVSDAGWRNIEQELDMDRDVIEDMADEVHDVRDVGAAIASGSFPAAAW